jgi:hypothetical protein
MNQPSEGELMVKITLREYRELVQESAKVSHYIGEIIKLEKENARLKDENVELSARADKMLIEYKTLYKEKLEREKAVEQVQNNV